MSNINVSTLEFYNYGETNRMTPALGPSYKVKVSDKDGNIITIEKDDSLYACVKLSFDSNSGILSLLDVAHDDSVLAEVEMPNADYIYNCRFDEASEKILFDVKSLYGNETDTIELDVQSLIELYEAGQGIEIGEKNEETGRKPISVKLAENDGLLTLTDDGLGIDDKVVTEDELNEAISGKADVDYVDELFEQVSGSTEAIGELSGAIDTIMDILGTDVDDPSIDERLDGKADLEEFNDLSEEVGDLEAALNDVSGRVDTLGDELSQLSGTVEAIDEKLDTEIEERKSGSVASVEYDSDEKKINFINANGETIDSIDATDFIKDGMIDSVELVTEGDTTYLVITWNTDAGKETTRIDIGDLFEADNYYSKNDIDAKVTSLQDMDYQLAQTDTQQWSVINQNRIDLEAVDAQQWSTINNLSSSATSLNSKIDAETTRAEAAEGEISGNVETEEARAKAREDELEGEIIARVDAEKLRATGEETRLWQALSAETARAEAAEGEFFGKVEAERDRAVAEEQALGQALHDGLRDVNNAISGFNAGLQDERDARIAEDEALEDAIGVIRDTYATVEYVDTKDTETLETAVNSAITESNEYTDNGLDTLEDELKEYCDVGHTELQNAISANTTKLNEITNDSNNGVLDVLHDEFHELTDGITAQQMSGLLADMLRRIEALENQ